MNKQTGVTMPKKEKEPTYKLFDKEYNQEELNALSSEQKAMIQHRANRILLRHSLSSQTAFP